MAFKYVHVFGEGRLPGFQRLYALGHVPLDNIMLDQLQRRGYDPPLLSRPWSRLELTESTWSSKTGSGIDSRTPFLLR